MAGVAEIAARGQQWAQEGKAREGGGGRNLWLRDGDKAIGYFVWSGQDGDPYMELYLTHDIPSKVQGQFGQQHLCPVESEFDLNYRCEYCIAGAGKLKKRMALWFYIIDILHAKPPEGEQLEAVPYQGQIHYRRPVNAPRIWDTSAWRESPLDVILAQAQMLLAGGQTMHSAMFQLSCVGSALATRFRVMSLPGMPGMDQAVYAKCRQECEPIIEWLASELKKPAATQVAPAAVTGSLYAPGASPVVPGAPLPPPAPVAVYQPAPVAPPPFPTAAPVQVPAPAPVARFEPPTPVATAAPAYPLVQQQFQPVATAEAATEAPSAAALSPAPVAFPAVAPAKKSLF